MPVALPPRRRALLRRHITRPWTRAARVSPAARRWLDSRGYITPHFSWHSYACTDGTSVPRHLRGNAIRLHWRLELTRHRLGDVRMTVDGPYRTEAKNVEVGGASDSRHKYADAADFFVTQVDHWIRTSPKLASRADVLRVVNRTFYNGGVGNEASGTLHVDTRGVRARFVAWTRSS